MHEVLIKIYLQNLLYRWVVNRETNLQFSAILRTRYPCSVFLPSKINPFQSCTPPFQIIGYLTFLTPKFDHLSYLKNLCKHSNLDFFLNLIHSWRTCIDNASHTKKVILIFWIRQMVELRIKKVKRPIIYNGGSTFVFHWVCENLGRSSSSTWWQGRQPRLSSWKAGLPSKAGRAVLIKSTLSAIPTHTALAINISSWTIKSIDKKRMSYM